MQFVKTTLVAAGLMVAGTLSAMAYPATVTSTVNVRSGPGTGYAVIGSLPGGATVDVASCGGNWCRTEMGYVSANYLGQGGGAPARVVVQPYYDGYYDDDYYDGGIGYGVGIGYGGGYWGPGYPGYWGGGGYRPPYWNRPPHWGGGRPPHWGGGGKPPHWGGGGKPPQWGGGGRPPQWGNGPRPRPGTWSGLRGGMPRTVYRSGGGGARFAGPGMGSGRSVMYRPSGGGGSFRGGMGGGGRRR